jgi:predicted RNA-binding protein with RPS1 domain
VDAPVVDHNKGGLIVDVRGVRGFVPVSQVLDLRNVSRQEGESEEVSQTLAAMQGRRLPLKIIEINRSRNRLILSERAAVQERRTQRKDVLLESLQPGQVRHGVVSNITSFGAFVDLGGADGLVHVSELSYNRVTHPNEIIKVGQEVDVMVLSVDRDTKKIALSLKRAQPDPWTTVEERYRLGQVVPAVITKLTKFGAFAKVEDGLEGLIHLSELTDLAVQDPSQVVHEGQHVDVKIIHIASQRRRLGLSVRQAGPIAPEVQSFGEDASPSFSPEDFGDYATEYEPTSRDEEMSALDAYIARQRAAIESEGSDVSHSESLAPSPVDAEPTQHNSPESLDGEPDNSAPVADVSDIAADDGDDNLTSKNDTAAAIAPAAEPDPEIAGAFAPQPAELEPQAPEVNGATAPTESDVPSTSDGPTLSTDEAQNERPEVAPATPQHSVPE